MLEGLSIWLLLPLGVALGWALGRGQKAFGAPDAETLTGLSHLANENPDRAIAALTRAVERDPAAAELNLTLGALFRKRGEIDRALHLHDTVLQMPTLTPELRARTLYELGQDCFKAGLLDRAEKLLLECSEYPTYAVAAMELLLQIYEQLSDWKRALEVAEELESQKGQSLAGVRAHYLCERAELLRHEAGEGKGLAEAIRLARRAQEVDPQCVRASLLVAQLEQARGNWHDALSAVLRVPEQDARFIPEALPLIDSICKASGAADTHAEVLVALERQHAMEPALWLAHAAQIPNGDEQALYLAGKLAQRPSWRALLKFLELPPAQSVGVLTEPVAGFRAALDKAMQQRPRYRCSHCGFTPSLLFWHCPSCKQWGTVHPADDRL